MDGRRLVNCRSLLYQTFHSRIPMSQGIIVLSGFLFDAEDVCKLIKRFGARIKLYSHRFTVFGLLPTEFLDEFCGSILFSLFEVKAAIVIQSLLDRSESYFNMGPDNILGFNAGDRAKILPSFL